MKAEYWNDYYEAVGDKPNTALVKTLDTFESKLLKRSALDLGAGNLRDSKYLLRRGFQSVTAVDRQKPPGEVPEGIKSIVRPLEQYMPMPNEFDFVCSFHTLYYFPEEVTTFILSRSFNALKEGGFMICNLLADKDDWAGKGGRYGHNQVRLLAMLNGMPHKQIRRTTGRQKSTNGQERNGDTWAILVQKPAAQ